MDLQRTEAGFRVTDAAKNTVVVETEGWREGGEPPSVAETLASVETGPDDPELTLTGTVGRLAFPSVVVTVVHLDEGWNRSIDDDESASLEAGNYLFRVDSNVRVFVRFDATVTVRREADDSAVLEFSEATPVSVAFESLVDLPDEVITVPRSLDGVAAAVSTFPVANETISPDRTWPTLRSPPPLVDFGRSFGIPESIRDRRPETDIELVVPRDLSYLITAAPLVHYLGADVTLDDGATPRLVVGDRDVPLGELPEFQFETASLLRRTFNLDCIARGAGPHGEELSVTHTFDDLGLDADRLYDAPLAERMRTYLDADFESVAHEFPEWHLSMYVEPSYEHVRTLPHLLANVPHLYLPESRPLSEEEWLELSASEGFHRGSVERLRTGERDGLERVTRQVSNVDLVRPELGVGREHGWLAPDVPVGVFKTFREAYQNRYRYLDGSKSRLSVVAVVNNDRMRAEHDQAVAHYETRADELNMDISVRENVGAAELARIFESRHDLVHFIGHREEEGLECADGYLSASTLAESNAQTFFLNACGSYHEGVELIKKGSVAGGVTFESVLDSDAAKVGTTFARLMVHGFSVKRGLDMARRQLMMPKDYAVVGDGTHVVSQSEALVPPERRLSRLDSDRFRLEISTNSTRLKGGAASGSLDEGTRHLGGSDRTYELAREELVEYLDLVDTPFVFEGALYWTEELRSRLN